MSRLRSNCSEIWLTPNEAGRLHRRQRRNLPELPLQRRRDQRGDHVGAGARQLRRHLHGREIDLRQRRNRQRPIAERAADHQRDPQQRGRDRPADERFGDAHGCVLMVVVTAALLRAGARSRGRSGLPLLVALAALAVLALRRPWHRPCRRPWHRALRLRLRGARSAVGARSSVPIRTLAPSDRLAKPVVTTRSDGREAAGDHGVVFVLLRHHDRLGGRDIVGADHIAERAGRTALHRRGRHHDRLLAAFRPSAAH